METKDTVYLVVGEQRLVVPVPEGPDGRPVRVAVAYTSEDHGAAVDFGNGVGVIRVALRERERQGRWRTLPALTVEQPDGSADFEFDPDPEDDPHAPTLYLGEAA